jgi:hypothetical protein
MRGERLRKQQEVEAMKATWTPTPHEKHGELTERSDLPDSVFAFPRERREPLTDAAHVRNAIARFDQVIDVSDDERALAFANIKLAAEHYGVDMSESDWEDLGRRPRTGRTAEDRRESAHAAVETKREREASSRRSDRRQEVVTGIACWSGRQS